VEPDAALILVIEDDPDLMRLMTHTLQSAGFRVIQAYGGEDALRKVKVHKPDLIVTDLAMPKMSGVEVIERVKEDPESEHIPCIAVTAYAWEHLAHCAKAAGCDGFLAKPVSAVRLRQEVAKYVPLAGTLSARTRKVK
jgi:two-component system cell cycle response regulator DivK